MRTRHKWHFALFTGLSLLLVCPIIACQTKPIVPTIVIFNAAPSQINLGESTSLNWVIQNATKVNIDQGIGDVAATGATKLLPTKTTAYTLTATNAEITVSKSVVIYVNVPVVTPSEAPEAPQTSPPPDKPAIVITNISVSFPNETMATISWLTDKPSDSQVDYGKTTDYGLIASPAEPLTTTHSVSLSNLEYNTTYHYRVSSEDNANNIATSEDQTFTTPAPKSPYSIELKGSEWGRETDTFVLFGGNATETKYLFIKGAVTNTSRSTLRGLFCTMNCWNGTELVKFETQIYSSPILPGNSLNFYIQTADDPTVDNVTVEFADPSGEPLIPTEK